MLVPPHSYYNTKFDELSSQDLAELNPGLKGGTGGGSGEALSSSLDFKVISARAHVISARTRRVRRFYHRYLTGVGVGGQVRILTLTSSDEAVERGYDIHRSFRALVLRLRRRFGRFEYIGVREKKGDREHLHIVFRGRYMEQAVVSRIWNEVHKSPVVDIRLIRGVKGGARYLAKYLVKGERNRYWTSYNWVFQGWIRWSQKVKQLVGRYPSKRIIRALARMAQPEREKAMWLLSPKVMMAMMRAPC